MAIFIRRGSSEGVVLKFVVFFIDVESNDLWRRSRSKELEETELVSGDDWLIDWLIDEWIDERTQLFSTGEGDERKAGQV